MPYYGRSDVDPSEMQGMSGNPFYNPLQSGPDWVRGVQAVYGQMAKAKQDKEAKKEEQEKKFKEELTFNLQLRQERDSAKKRALELKQLEREARDYMDPMTKRFLDKMDDKKKQKFELEKIAAQNEGRIQVAGIKKATTAKGTSQLKNLESAAKRVEAYSRMYEGALTQLMANPLTLQQAGGKAEEYRNIAEGYRNAAAEIEAMKTRLDENGELEDKDYARLQSLLKVPQSIRTGANRKHLSWNKSPEDSLPPGFKIIK
jgi:hypothetical protein